MADKIDFSLTSYILGIVSIVLAFFQPLAGLTFGIIGFVQSKKQKTPLAKTSKKLNKIGIILSSILLAISITVIIYSMITGTNILQNLPTA